MVYLTITILYLAALSAGDIKTRTIPVWPVPVYLILAAAAHLILRDLGLRMILEGMLPGAVLLLLSLNARAGIGSGDALAVAACGAALGPEAELSALVLSLLLCAACSAVLLLRRKVKRSDTLPFLPFLTAGHAALLMMEACM